MTIEAPRRSEGERNYGRLIILTGATASGKTELKTMLEQRGIKRIVTATTRNPRAGETPGLDYHFYSRSVFSEHVDNGAFVEWAEYNGNYYGTPKSELEPLFTGHNLVTSTEIRGAVDFTEHVRNSYDQETAELLLSRISRVFIGLDSLHDARQRFLGREKETTGAVSSQARKTLRQRLRSEWVMWNELKGQFDHIIYNKEGEIHKAVEQLEALYR